MGKVILGITMSLDGFINDRNGSMAELYPDLVAFSQTDVMQESIEQTGAVVMGRHSFDLAEDPDSLEASYEYQVPIFVVTHRPLERHPRENDRLTITFVTDGFPSAVAQAKAAAGSRDVTIIGATNTARQCLQAGLADELHIDVMPVLLGGGLRMFAETDSDVIRLERIKVVEMPGGRTHLRYRILK